MIIKHGDAQPILTVFSSTELDDGEVKEQLSQLKSEMNEEAETELEDTDVS